MKAYIDHEIDYTTSIDHEPEPQQQKSNKNDEKFGAISIIMIATFIIWLVSGWVI